MTYDVIGDYIIAKDFYLMKRFNNKLFRKVKVMFSIYKVGGILIKDLGEITEEKARKFLRRYIIEKKKEKINNLARIVLYI